MKAIKLLVITAVISVIVAGCVGPSKNYDPTKPVSADNPKYATDLSGFNANLGKVAAVNDLTAPVDPYAGLIKTGLELLGAGVTGVSVLVARAKNSQAAKSHAVATVLAQAIPSTSVQAVIESASTPEIAGLVAAHFQTIPS